MTEKIRSIQIIHLALCAGVILAYVLMYNFESIIDVFSVQKILIEDYFYIAIPVIAFFASNFIYRTLLKKANENATEDYNFNMFQTASIARWAILEGSAFIILFMTPDFIIFGILILIYLILLRPTEDQFKNDINFH